MAEKSYLLTKRFWAAASERAIKTGAQVALASGILDVTQITDLEINYKQVLFLTALGIIGSYLTSIASGGFGDSGGPSLGPEILSSQETGNGNPGTSTLNVNPEVVGEYSKLDRKDGLPGKHEIGEAE